MGSVFNRGTRDNPRWWVKYKHPDGVFRMENSHQPTKLAAKDYLRQQETIVAAGGAGMERVDGRVPLCGPLMEKWRDGLINRAAKDDRAG